MKIIRNCICLVFLFFSGSLYSQILKDTADINLIRKGVDYIYDLKFDKARDEYNKISEDYPENPIPYLFRGIITYWEDYPLIPGSPGVPSFKGDMRKCMDLAEGECSSEDYPEYLLADLCARGMLLMYYADNDISMSVLSLAPSTYRYIRRSFDYTREYNDFYFFTGLYNYYREEYVDVHPVYKSLALLFPRGSRTKGLKELQIASKSSIFLRADAYSYLSYIYIGYENDYEQSLVYLDSLHRIYPANMVFRTEYIKNLLLLKRYGEAESVLKSCDTLNLNNYFKACIIILDGILEEKVRMNYRAAKDDYNSGLVYLDGYGNFADDYRAIAYFGLSRISGFYGDKANRKKYRKKALNIASFKKINFDN
ncbi:MAG TPA: hypothetical protein VJ963_14585 [Bacteroidales bacterium]|nr:hypothetical protein [Bacteroidales bacterium]